MIFPEFDARTTVQVYLRHFLDVNRQADRRKSARFFAKRLDWSSSLMPDVIKGRKRLSIQRALEFCSLARFSERRTQLFVFKAVCENQGEGAERFLERFIVSNFRTFLTASPTHDEEEIIASALASAVLGLVQARPGIDAVRIEQLLDTFDREELRQIPRILERLIVAEMIKRTAAGFQASGVRTIVLEKAAGQPAHWSPRTYAESLLRFIDLARPSAQLHGATVAIPQARLPEVRERLAEVRDWALALGEDARQLTVGAESQSPLIAVQMLLAAYTVHPVIQ